MKRHPVGQPLHYGGEALVELGLLEVVPVELGVEVGEGLDANVVKVRQLDDLLWAGAKVRGGAEQQLKFVHDEKLLEKRFEVDATFTQQ